MTNIKEQDWEKLKEKLADIEHQRWAYWQQYVHSKCCPSADDGIWQIGEEFLIRWDRQIKTPYSELSEKEKQSDRDQVDRYLPLIQDFIRSTRSQLLQEIEERVKEQAEPYDGAKWHNQLSVETIVKIINSLK